MVISDINKTTPLKPVGLEDRDGPVGPEVRDDSPLLQLDSEDHLADDPAWLKEQRLLHRSTPWLTRPSVFLIGLFVVLLCFTLAAGEPARQMVQFKLACNSVAPAGGSCDPIQTQLLVLSFQQAIVMVQGVATVFALGKIAPLLDVYGRKPFLAVIVVLLCAGKAAKYYVTSQYPTLQFYSMVCIEFLANCCGGIMNFLALANCYIADIAELHQRTYFFSLMMACVFLGFLAGPVFGNFLLARAKHLESLQGPLELAATEFWARLAPGLTPADFAPLRFEMASLFCLALVAVFVLPESRAANARRMSRLMLHALLRLVLIPEQRPLLFDRLNFLKPLRLLTLPKDCIHSLRHGTLGRDRLAVMVLVATDCFVTSCAQTLGEVYVLYGIFKFGWTAQNLAHLMFVGCAWRAMLLIVLSPVLSRTVAQGWMGLPLLKRRFDLVEYGLVMFAFTCEAVGQIGLGLAPLSTVFMLVIGLTAMALMGGPALNSAVIKFFPESKTGEVFGSILILKNLLSIVMPILFLGVYKAAVLRQVPQIVFFMVSGIFTVAMAALTAVIVMLERAEPSLPTSTLSGQAAQPVA